MVLFFSITVCGLISDSEVTFFHRNLRILKLEKIGPHSARKHECTLELARQVKVEHQRTALFIHLLVRYDIT